MKRILSAIGKCALALLACLLLYAAMALLLPYIPAPVRAFPLQSDTVTVFIRTNGVHTDLVVPVKHPLKDWRSLMRFTDTESKDSNMHYASVGWGDRGFYLQTPNWSDLRFSVAFKAMFHLGSSAMHVNFLKSVHPSPTCVQIRLSQLQYLSLVGYIERSFRKDANGNSVVIPSVNDGYGPDDAFYESPYTYDLFHTCNTWANNALKAAGKKACLWTATDKGIFFQYRSTTP